ncbi:hypothetical protein [Streptomyces laurentii]|uniref:hypothetical protein n=1 Tax=Streptomyces laurentii TaxID=39478 RepID=UPI0033CDAD50
MSDRIEHVQMPLLAATVFMAGPEGLAVIDLVAVERAVSGTRRGARLTEDEARYAASVLLDAGFAASVVARKVGYDTPKILKWFPEQAKTARLEPIRCGTPRGYRAHLRKNQTACADCKAAEAYRRRTRFSGVAA